MEAWDDIRFFLALVRYGSVRSAAAALKVNHTTVSRRMRGLELRLGSRLLQRTPEGYVLTPDGEMIFASGETIEDELNRVAQKVEGSDSSISGTVRIALPDILPEIIGPVLQVLLREYPGLKLEVSVSPYIADIARLETDVALRLAVQPPDGLVGKILGRMPVAVYGAKQFLSDAEAVDLNAVPWIRWQEPWKQLRLETWPDQHFPKAHVAARVDSYAVLERLVASGAGVGILSPWSADHRDDLVQLSDILDEAGIDLWLLMHPDLRGVQRTRIVVDVLTRELRKIL